MAYPKEGAACSAAGESRSSPRSISLPVFAGHKAYTVRAELLLSLAESVSSQTEVSWWLVACSAAAFAVPHSPSDEQSLGHYFNLQMLNQDSSVCLLRNLNRNLKNTAVCSEGNSASSQQQNVRYFCSFTIKKIMSRYCNWPLIWTELPEAFKAVYFA